jgi:hypothetical protein
MRKHCTHMTSLRHQALRTIAQGFALAAWLGTSLAIADTIRTGPIVKLPGSTITLPLPAPASNANAANPNAVGDVITQRNNNLRTGTTQHGGLDQASVSDGRFGFLTQWEVDGVVLAQPLFLASVQFPQGRRAAVFIATSTNWVYAFNADPPFDKLWERQLGAPYRIEDAWNENNPASKNCPTQMAATQHDQETGRNSVVMGIESTPVIDPQRQRIVVSYRAMDGIRDGAQRIAALDVRTGQFARDANGGNLDRRVTDNPLWNQVHRNRASLLLDGGNVYVGFSGRCESTEGFYKSHAYQGWVYAFAASDLAFAGRYRSTETPGAPAGDPTQDPISGGGIWQASTGLAADGHGNLFFATGNATLGSQVPDGRGKDLSNSVVRLNVAPLRGRSSQSPAITMTAVDWFTPYRKTWLDALDLDFAAAGVMLIPNAGYLVAAGKDGVLYVLDRRNLGKFDDGTRFDTNAMRDQHTSEDPIALDDPQRDHVVQKFRVGINQYCAAGPNPFFCLKTGQAYSPQTADRTRRGVTTNEWLPWPHVHGTPVFGAFPNGRAFLYVWPEKDFLKSFRWWGKRFDTLPTLATARGTAQAVLAPPYLSHPAGSVGMPGGMLSLSINATQPAAGVLFAAVQRCIHANGDQRFSECAVPRCSVQDACVQQNYGMLRAFDPITLRELWNDQHDSFSNADQKRYYAAKFVPPTIAHGRVFLATGSGRVLVYGRH